MFLTTLKQLQDHLHEEADFSAFTPLFSQLQEQFQKEILSLTGEDLTGETRSVWQSSQTEIHRTMRLLQNDLMFLQTSRSRNTSQQRLQTVRDRVEKLIHFATALIQE